MARLFRKSNIMLPAESKFTVVFCWKQLYSTVELDHEQIANVAENPGLLGQNSTCNKAFGVTCYLRYLELPGYIASYNCSLKQAAENERFTKHYTIGKGGICEGTGVT